MEDSLLDGAIDDIQLANKTSKNQEPVNHSEQEQFEPTFEPTNDLSGPPDWGDIPPATMDDMYYSDEPFDANLDSVNQNLTVDSMETSEANPIANTEFVQHSESESKLTSSFTLAQLAGDEEVEPHEKEDLAYERLILLQSLREYDENQALQALGDSDILNGSLSGDRVELVGRALKTMRSEGETFVNESLNKMNDAVREGKPLADGDIRFSERDPALFANLLDYSENKSSIGNKLISFARNSVNSELIRESYANGGNYTANELGKAQKEVLESYTGIPLKTSLGTRDILTDVVRKDIELAKEKNDYSLLIRAAIGNQDYKGSLVKVLSDDFSLENSQNKFDKAAKTQYINDRLKEINENNSSEFKLSYGSIKNKSGKSYSDITYSHNDDSKLEKEEFKTLSTFSKNHIADRLNGVEPKFDKKEKLNPDNKNEGKTFDPKDTEQERRSRELEGKGPYYLTSLYFLGKEAFKGTSDLISKIGEGILKTKNYVMSGNIKDDLEKSKSFASEKVSDLKSKTSEFVAKNVTPHFYDTREPLNKAEQAVYKPTEEFAGFKVSPKLHTHSFGQELAKLHEYTNAMNGVVKNPKNADLVFDKLGSFHSVYNSTIRGLQESPKNHSEFTNEFDARIEAKKHAARIINDYQDLSMLSIEKRKLADDTSKFNAYNELSKRGLSMTQQLAKPTMEIKGDMERKAHELYKDSLFLNYYANDIENRKKLGLDTKEAERRLEKRIESIAQEKFELSQMIKNANTKGAYKNKDEALISLNKVNEYMDLSLDLEKMAKLNPTASKKIDELDKSKDKGFDLDKMLQNFAESTQKMLNSLTNIFSKKTSQMGASV